MRAREEIDKEIKRKTGELDYVIDEAVDLERDYERRTKKLQEAIRILKKENPFEETLTGKVAKLKEEVCNKIKILLDDLEQVTGVPLEFELYLKQKSESYPRTSGKFKGISFPGNEKFLKELLCLAGKQRLPVIEERD